MKGKLYHCKHTDLVGVCVRTEDQGRVLILRAGGNVHTRTESEVEPMGKKDVEDRVAGLLWHAQTYGQLETLAGIVDRYAFWKNKTEDEARGAAAARS